MLLLDLMRGVEFTEEEYAIFEHLCRAYVAYDPKIASFLLLLMNKDPKENNYKFSRDGLTLKWVTFSNEGVIGAFNPFWPKTFFLGQSNSRNSFDESNENENSLIKSEDRKRLNLNESTTWILLQFPTIMHELYHMLQFKTSKVGYIAMRLITLFTTIPYYLFQEASWMPSYRKFCIWDLEGQAEAYGDKAPNIHEFIDLVMGGFDGYEYERRSKAKIERWRREGSMTEEEIKESQENDKLVVEEMFKTRAGSFGKKWGKELFDIIQTFCAKQ